MPTASVHWLPRQAQHLRTVSGFCGARVLCREDGQKVMFTSITFVTSLDAVHGLLETLRTTEKTSMLSRNLRRHHRGN